MPRVSKRGCYEAACETITDLDNEEVLQAIKKELGRGIDRLILDDIGYDIVKNPFSAMFLHGFYIGMRMERHKLEGR